MNIPTRIANLGSDMYPTLLAVLVLTLLGGLGSYFPLDLGNHISLHFGHLGYLLAASLFHPFIALCIAALSLLPGLLADWPMWILALYFFEAAWVSVLRTRCWPILISSATYWLVFVLPVLLVVNRGQFSGEFGLECLQMMINGLLMASVTQLIVDGFQLNRANNALLQLPLLPQSLKAVLLRGLLAFAVFLVLVVGLALNINFENRDQERQQRHMLQDAELLGAILEEFLNEHLQVLNNMANKIGQLDADDAAKLLLNIQSSRSGFVTMLYADARGRILLAAPEDALLATNENKLSIIDRDYFKTPVNEKRPFISEPFEGRGFGNDIIVAMSVPVFDNRKNVIGVLEGSLQLEKVGIFRQFDSSTENERFVIVDSRQRVVLASNGFELSILDRFELTQYSNTQGWVLSEDIIYSMAGAELSNGWTVYVLHPNNVILDNILKHFSILILTLGFVILLALLLNWGLAMALGRPIEKLVDYISSGGGQSLSDNEFAIKEINLLVKSYKQDEHAKQAQREMLEENVQRRNLDLIEANKQLTRQALFDGLTGINNVRSLSERFAQLRSLVHRSDGRLIALIIDIDFLKRINDNYGYEVGDQGIKGMAALLSGCFQREYDVLARIGNDRFVLMTQVFDWQVFRQYIEDCRVKIASTSIPVAGDKEISLTVSMGGLIADASWSLHYQDWLHVADKELRRAKEKGKNCIVTISDDSQHKIEAPSTKLLEDDIEQYQALFIASLHEDQLSKRFYTLRSNLSRTGGALLVIKISQVNQQNIETEMSRDTCRQLLQFYKRGYDTLAMLESRGCLVLTVVASENEARVVIETSLKHLSNYVETDDEFIAGAVMANANWQIEIDAWLEACDDQLLQAKTKQQTYELLCLAGKVI